MLGRVAAPLDFRLYNPKVVSRSFSGTNKPPQYTEGGGFDMYRAQPESSLSQRGCRGVLDGTDVRHPSNGDEQIGWDKRNLFARDTMLRGLLTKDAKPCVPAA
ncbi:hypothetical protein PC116_g23332 [Phytophthora cactorum]|uniref:Uncharacterized protein n=1 Tax=Phytophthora cactorum TaxID=29920 RepID=A0A329RVG5_9STRA|nr:hypothetical protein PC114_g21027 [Phytophthora cactorum]KAG2907735.1 hypothetical protein PC117_g20149 [Phytophthora cactorum]KAG2984031.1 hypothetical protein PC119_g20487 [Phytophthora cactorum]KAG3001832.1 hypothetical protein PC120_g20047 [Phytophthora cactorum]KAG3136593.1 hypothetical protein C6341_g21326 [Phytophthora cactorum]